jgi:hypothetical protein
MDPSGETQIQAATKAAALQTLTRRRRRVWRNLILITIITAVMVALSMAERDNQSLRGSVKACRDNLEFAAAKLQEAFDRGQPAPTRLPLPQDPAPPGLSPAALEAYQDAQLDRILHYHYEPTHRKAVSPGRKTIICYCVKPHALYLHDDRRHVILFDGQKYEVASLSETEFRRRAAELGIPLP